MNFLTRIRNSVYTFTINALLSSVKFLRSKRRISKQIEKISMINNLSTQSPQLDFSIIIVTFEARFFEFTIPLITTLRSVSNAPIFVMVNGNFEKKFNNHKLQEFLEKLVVFPDIYPSVFSNFRGCAELWNTGIINADSEYNLILNDDIHVFPEHLNYILNTLCESLQNNHLVTINRSFSHFGITRKCIQEVGFFDEHFLGIGEEDRDYVFRFESRFKKSHFNLPTEVFLNISDKSRDNAITGINASNFTSKYSMFNFKMFQELYEADPTSSVKGVYDLPMNRKNEFVDPRPVWKFRGSNYGRLAE
jgi:hypothetical protein